MSTDDIDTSYINHRQDHTDDISIKIQNGTFKWIDENEKPREEPNPKSPQKGKPEGSELSPMKKNQGQGPKQGVDLEGSAGIKRTPEVILKDINMEVKSGSFVAILGEYINFKNCIKFFM